MPLKSCFDDLINGAGAHAALIASPDRDPERLDPFLITLDWSFDVGASVSKSLGADTLVDMSAQLFGQGDFESIHGWKSGPTT